MAKSKYTPATRKRILRALEVGATRKMAYTMAGVGHDTFYSWMRENVEFSEAVEKAEAHVGIVQLERLEAAVQEGDTATAKWILERKFPDEFGKRIDLRMQYSPQQIEGLADVLQRMLVRLSPEDQELAVTWLDAVDRGLPLPEDVLALPDGMDDGVDE